MHAGETANSSVSRLIISLDRSKDPPRAAISPQIIRSRQLAPRGRECSEIDWDARSRGVRPAPQAVGFWGEKSFERSENPIDRTRFEEYGGVVRKGSRPKEIRGLASADRTASRVTRVLDGCRRGWAKIRAAGATTADFADMAREVFPDPGASKQRSKHERSSLSSSQRCGLIRSGCKPVHSG